MKRKGRKYISIIMTMMFLVSFFPGYNLAEETPSAEQQTYTIQYLLQDNVDPVPGLDPLSGSADVGSTITVPQPVVEGYQLIEGQAENLLISEDAEQNKLYIYYRESETVKEAEPKAELNPVLQQVYEICYLLEGTNLPVPGLEPVSSSADVGSTIAVPQPDVEGYQIFDVQPTELVISEEAALNQIKVYYQESTLLTAAPEKQEQVEEPAFLGENPDHLTEFSSGITKAESFFYPSIPRMMMKSLSLFGAETWPAPGSLNLGKTATPVTGHLNQWEITLTIEGKNIQTTSDVVLVIDKSGSMAGSKMTNTILAAKEFVDKLLLEDNTTRIAVVSFDKNSNVVEQFTDYSGKEALKTSIGGIVAAGGTNIQAGIHQAQILLDSSSANNKVMVLLGDGEPTYSYKVSDASGITLTGHDFWGSPQISYDNPQITAIDYGSIVGSGKSYNLGSSSRYQIPCTVLGHGGSHPTTFPANNGIPTIYEAGLAKAKGTNIYSIALEADANGESVLNGCQDSGYFELNSSDLSGLSIVFAQIAGDIAFAASAGQVTDPMGSMFDLVSNATQITVSQGTVTISPSNQINWNVGNIAEGVAATMKYIVQIKAGADANENYPTNLTTTLAYTDAYGESASKDFEIPEVSIGKGNIYMKGYLVNESGQPISEGGTVVARPDLAKRLYDTSYPGNPLEYNQTYNVVQPGVLGYQYVKYVLNDFTGPEGTVSIELLSSAPTQTVWFGYCKVEKANVYYDANTGIGTLLDTNSPYNHGAEVTVLANTAFTKEGYSFTGWNTKADGTGTDYAAGDKFNMPSENVTLYAQWSVNSYTVTFYEEDGTTVITTTTYNYGDTVVVPTAPAKAADETNTYAFAGWNPTVVSPVVGDAEYVATYTPTKIDYTVTFYEEDGTTVITTTTYNYGDTVVVPTAPAKAADETNTYAFAGWNPTVVSPVVGDAEYVATYTPTKIDYTIIYQAGTNGTLMGGNRTDVKNFGDSYSAAPVPVANSGYRFNGWTPALPGASDIVTENKTFTANFTWSGGGGGGGDNYEPIIVEPEPPVAIPLNKDDHFAYVVGYPNNTVRPEGNVTREEVAAVFYRLLDANYRETIKTTSNDFPDVGLDRWSSKHIGTLASVGIVVGYPDGSFRPGNSITRAEIATIASKFDKLSPFTDNRFSDIMGHWANQYINSAAQKGWVAGYPDGTFKPDQAITRAEFMTLVNNVLDRRVLQEDILPDARQFPDLLESAWYYEEVQEAINSHHYERATRQDYEIWTDIYYPELDM